MSSRYKLGLKQIDAFGPSGETLLDYAIYDAIRAGFGKAVFVIRRQMKDDFEKLVTSKYKNKIEYELVFQEVDDVPDIYEKTYSREKPWGTGHAVWAARKRVKEAFAVVNADDFYGSESYKTMAEFLKGIVPGVEGKYSMVGFNLGNTLSDYSSVSRGICTVKDGYLLDIDERTGIHKQDNLPLYKDEKDLLKQLDPNAVTSMNLWGFSPDLFSRFDDSFGAFLAKNADNINSEFYLPDWIKEQLKKGKTTVKVLSSSSQWLGITSPDDKPVVIEKLKSYVDSGFYPSPLF